MLWHLHVHVRVWHTHDESTRDQPLHVACTARSGRVMSSTIPAHCNSKILFSGTGWRDHARSQLASANCQVQVATRKCPPPQHWSKRPLQVAKSDRPDVACMESWPLALHGVSALSRARRLAREHSRRGAPLLLLGQWAHAVPGSHTRMRPHSRAPRSIHTPTRRRAQAARPHCAVRFALAPTRRATSARARGRRARAGGTAPKPMLDRVVGEGGGEGEGEGWGDTAPRPIRGRGRRGRRRLRS